jgi:hypothetical protein
MNDEGFLAIENSTIFQGIMRFVFRNSRVKTISNLNNFYATVFNHIDTAAVDNASDFISNKDREYSLKTLLIYLRKSVTGVENLKETYSGDIVTTSKLDIILDNIRLYSNKLEKKLSNYC